jgi:hypothetical protein
MFCSTLCGGIAHEAPAFRQSRSAPAFARIEFLKLPGSAHLLHHRVKPDHGGGGREIATSSGVNVAPRAAADRARLAVAAAGPANVRAALAMRGASGAAMRPIADHHRRDGSTNMARSPLLR